jgi:DNA helicase IV
MPHADLAAEQAHVDAAYARAEALRDHALGVSRRDDLSASEIDGTILQQHFEERARSLDSATRGVLCFGRIDEGSRVLHIGRTHVEEGDGRLLVVDWRARAAIPFYRATLAEPLGLDRRRRFMFERRTLVDIMEEDFADPEGSLANSGGVPDPLLAELGRARGARMRDIAATIQAEQDVVIRAPTDRCLIVQGGPGTGKTAVGLHRAAFLLFEHRERLLREGVLVVGPNKLFLNYIEQVLPTLGERSVRQVTVATLLARWRVEAFDPPAAARVKADARMAEVIARAAADLVVAPAEDLVFPVGSRRALVRRAHALEILDEAMGRPAPWASRRETFRSRVLRAAFESLADAEQGLVDPDDFQKAALAGPGRRALDRCWPSTTGEALVRRLLTSRPALARAAAGVLSEEEQAAVLRKRPARGQREQWTDFDLPLLDEAETLVTGVVRRYGHVVIDEAQDRTPMELRVLGRRALRGSMTVLGDLAQGTSVSAATRWEDVAAHLAPPSADLVELTIGYRLPGALLDFANRLLPVAAPDVTPAVSVRETGDPPAIHTGAAEDLDEAAAELAIGLSHRYGALAVVVAHERLDRITRLLDARDARYVADGGETLEGRIAVLSPTEAKGLEFDAVIVVEPAEIVRDEPGAERALFVALTRAVQHLAILRSEDLPAALANAPQPIH